MRTPACGDPNCCASIGVHGGPTFGFGKLSEQGHWEIPCELCARAWDKLHPGDPAWPFPEKGPLEDTYEVKLTYFKPTGKYYSEGSYHTPKETPMHQIYGVVAQLLAVHDLPGLVRGAVPYIILVEVPSHPHNCPHLIIPAVGEVVRAIWPNYLET